MGEAIESLEFERAAELRDQIQAIDTVMTRQKMTLTDLLDRDVFGYSVDKGWMCVQVFFIRQGKLIEREVSLFPFTTKRKKTFDIHRSILPKERALHPKRNFCPQTIEREPLEVLLKTKVLQPQRGDKKNWST